VAICREHGAPVLPRGAGTSLAGQTVNVAVVLDTSRHLREIVEIDPQAKVARVQPGVIRDQLARATEPEHLITFAPDTSTHAYATFGGMIGNNSCGMHSVMAGRTSDNVRELEVVTYDGLRLRVGATSEEELAAIIAAGGRRGALYSGMRDLRDRYGDLVRARYPDIPRRVSGYNLDDLLPEKGFHVARAVTGSEGTLVTILEATVELVDSPPYRALIALGYPDVFEAADHVPEVMATGPTACEGMDRTLVDDMLHQGMHSDDVEMLPAGDGWLIVEYAGWTKQEADERARAAVKELRGGCKEVKEFEDPGEEQRLWGVREAGLGATAYYPGGADHYEGWEDTAVAPERFGAYLRDFQALLDEYGYETTKYGHFGQGLVHCRIDFDLSSAGGLHHWRSFLEEGGDLVARHGGVFSGEHGDGQSKAEMLDKLYGPELVQAFREYKALWDPQGRMNPGKVADPWPIVSNLRLGTDHNPPEPKVRFAYASDGGSYAHAMERCVGAGLCRDSESGTMCPSYMVTLDEEHSTRGRARILGEMLRGETITGGFRSKDVHQALDLCLACKGCKGDCPVSVDMAKYKAEFLSHHFKRRLRPRAAYSMGLIPLHARLASRAPRLVNALVRAPGLGRMLKRAGGIAPQREMPPFARETFRAWFARRGTVNPDGEPVVLFPDTFNDTLHPEPMKAACQVLEATGRRVVLPDGPLCCGRPLYDYGMLATAERLLHRLVAVLRPYIREGVPVVGVEPSCIAVFRDELVGLLPHDEDAKRLSLQALTLAEFLGRHEPEWEPPQLHRKALLHLHCHHAAVMGKVDEQRLLERMGMDVELLDAGCCGMAGAFGFEAEHYDVSVAVGERRLLPIVRDMPRDALLVGDGFSCKTQVSQLTGRRPLHIAQVLLMAMQHGADGPAGNVPEQWYPDVCAR
jgi:FAD/FMN-containing dehydrogenase/Fe-S oxidoreductase